MFLHHFSTFMDNDVIIMDWQYCVSFFSSYHHFLMFYFSWYLVHFLFISVSLHLKKIVILGGLIIACCSIQRYIEVLESNIDIYNSLLFPMCEPKKQHISQHVAPQWGSVFAPPPRKMAKRNFDLLCV